MLLVAPAFSSLPNTNGFYEEAVNQNKTLHNLEVL
jgi:hypothetical protein